MVQEGLVSKFQYLKGRLATLTARITSSVLLSFNTLKEDWQLSMYNVERELQASFNTLKEDWQLQES